MKQEVTPTASQGPDWLAAFLIQPPLWFKAAIILAAGLCLVIVARKVATRDLYISREEQWSMVVILATVEGVAAGVIVSMGALQVGYVGDVMVGLAVGFIGVDALRLVLSVGTRPWLDGRMQLAGAWMGLFVVGGSIPVLAGQLGVPAPPGLDVAAGGLAVVMLFWTFAQEFGPGETVADAFRAASEK